MPELSFNPKGSAVATARVGGRVGPPSSIPVGPRSFPPPPPPPPPPCPLGGGVQSFNDNLPDPNTAVSTYGNHGLVGGETVEVYGDQGGEYNTTAEVVSIIGPQAFVWDVPFTFPTGGASWRQVL